MKIGELSKKTGCKVVTIRYYEKEGLLKTPERTEGNYRVYSKKDMDRLEFIIHCRRHGMVLDEIKELLVFRDHPHTDCTWVTHLLRKHIREKGSGFISAPFFCVHFAAAALHSPSARLHL